MFTNFFRNLLSRKVKARNTNLKEDKSFDVSGINVDTQSGSGGIGSISRKVKKEPAVFTETTALSELRHTQVSSAIEGIDDYQKRENLKVDYVQQLISGTSNKPLINGNTIPTDNGIGCSNNLNNGKGQDLKKYLDDRHFKSTALPNSLNTNQGYVIWPVALLARTTFIHKAQSQIIKLLTDCGWKLLVIIGDCGKNSAIPNKSEFIDGIKKILTSQAITIKDSAIARISEYYIQESVEDKSNIISEVTGSKILQSFHNISGGLIWSQFDALIKKNYDDSKQSEIEKRTVLNNIQPLLTWSLVATIVKESKSKAIVIAGEDEQAQWDYITNSHTNNNLGVIYIHELKKENDKTMDQEDLQMRNKQEMETKLPIGNMAKWLYTHFVELPKYTSGLKPDFCKISENACAQFNNNCIDCLFGNSNNFDNTDFDKTKFVEHVYPISNPAN